MFSCTCLVAQQPDRTLDWKALLNWLPTDTQTLIVAPKPFVIPTPKQDGGTEMSPVDVLRGFALGPLPAFPVLYQALVGHTVKLAVSGVREFRSFSGVGLGPYEGCAVIVFSDSVDASLHAAISELPKEDWSGMTIFFLSMVREGSLRTLPEQLNLLITQLGPKILIAATDRSSLKFLLERRAALQPGPALPDGLSEWGEVNVTAPVWAILHYKHTYNRTKGPVLSLGPLEKVDDPEAVGIVYNAQPPGPAQKVYYFSRNQNAAKLARHHWEWKEEGLATPEVRRKSGGVAEVLVSTPTPEATASFVFLLLSTLGYTMAL